jgi:hypothetical protein
VPYWMRSYGTPRRPSGQMMSSPPLWRTACNSGRHPARSGWPKGNTRSRQGSSQTPSPVLRRRHQVRRGLHGSFARQGGALSHRMLPVMAWRPGSTMEHSWLKNNRNFKSSCLKSPSAPLGAPPASKRRQTWTSWSTSPPPRRNTLSDWPALAALPPRRLPSNATDGPRPPRQIAPRRPWATRTVPHRQPDQAALGPRLKKHPASAAHDRDAPRRRLKRRRPTAPGNRLQRDKPPPAARPGKPPARAVRGRGGRAPRFKRLKRASPQLGNRRRRWADACR